MAKNQNRRLTPAQLQADLDALAALQSFSDYAPANAVYAKTAVASIQSKMKNSQGVELNTQKCAGSVCRRDPANAETSGNSTMPCWA